MAMTIDCRERGQLLLVLATFIALIIMSSVVLLNAFYAPADVGATTERTGLSEADTTTTEVSGDLQEVYLKSASINGEPVPALYRPGDETSFEKSVEIYNKRRHNISSRYATGIVSITFDREASTKEGFVLRQNNSGRMTEDGAASGSWTVVDNADDGGVPYVYLNVTAVDSAPGDPFVLHANASGSGDNENIPSPGGADYNLTIVENGADTAHVLVGGTRVCREELEVPFEVELTDDGVEVIDSVTAGTDVNSGTRCGNVTSTRYGDVDVNNLYIAPGSNPVEGNYSIVATGSSAGSDFDNDPADGRREIDATGSTVIDPHFRIRYVAPGVQYHANVTALGGAA